MQETHNNCFGSKKRNESLRLVKIGKPGPDYRMSQEIKNVRKLFFPVIKNFQMVHTYSCGFLEIYIQGNIPREYFQNSYLPGNLWEFIIYDINS